jgi:hypothetical protein
MDDLTSFTLTRLRIKCDQAWELTALARRDGDQADELRWLERALRLQAMIREIAK